MQISTKTDTVLWSVDFWAQGWGNDEPPSRDSLMHMSRSNVPIALTY